MKDSFCNRLEELVTTVLKSDHTFLMGDQNAKVRRDTESWKGVIVRQERRHCIGVDVDC